MLSFSREKSIGKEIGSSIEILNQLIIKIFTEALSCTVFQIYGYVCGKTKQKAKYSSFLWTYILVGEDQQYRYLIHEMMG